MRKEILNKTYIKWVEETVSKYGVIDDVGFILNGELSDKDVENVCSLKYFFEELFKYSGKINNKYSGTCYLKYNGNFYSFSFDGKKCICKKVDDVKDDYIDYRSFRNSYKKSTDEIFNDMRSTVIDSFKKTDLDRINYELSKISDPTSVTGVGGSKTVSDFASKVLNEKNKIITRNSEVRDLKYMDLSGYKNVMSCSYSGKNYGVDLSFDNNLKKYLFTGKDNKYDGVTNLKYEMDPEDSFISLGSTLVPCSVLLNYYLDGDRSFVNDIHDYNFDFDSECEAIEIFSGYDTSTINNYLESTITEAGIGVPVVHDKYAYCHGRSTLCKDRNNIAIYLNRDTDLDKLLLSELPKYYKDVVKIDVEKGLEGEYKALIEAMYLTKYLSKKTNKDLMGVDYSPLVKKLYYFKGNL